MSVALPKQGVPVSYDFHSQSLAAVNALPGVKAAAYDWGLPLTGDKWFDQLVIDGQAEAANPSDIPVVAKRTVSSGYFSVFNIPILEGRNFRTEDNWVGWQDWNKPEPGEVPPVCIINQALAKEYFPNSNPLGQKLRIGPWRKRPCEIVGIAADTRTESLTQTADPEIYVSFFQCIPFTKHLIVRTAADPRTMIAAVRQAVRSVDPVVSIDHIRTFDQIRAESVAAQTFAMRLLVGFSLAGSVLALVGLYGVLSLSVGSRKREIAIRMAVGAQPRDVLGVILTEGMKLIIAGLALGTGVALVLARVLKALLFGVAPADPMTFAGVALFFTAVALLACCIPARRAATIDPMTALRYE